MEHPLAFAAFFAAVALVGVLALRRFSNKVRGIFDVSCFLAISLYLVKVGASPLLQASDDAAPANLLSFRVVVGAWWLLGARVLVAVLWLTLHRNSQTRATRLSSDVTSAVIYIAAILVILKSVLFLPLSGVLATSGLLAVVLGLALQNTLGDVFAGIAVGVEAPFKVGDRIALADKLEGQVVQVNWRSVWIQTDDDDVAIIPHSLVARNQIVNRSYPTPRRSVSVQLSCPHNALPEHVIQAILSATWLCPPILRAPAPSAVLVQLGGKRHRYSISFSVEGTRGLASTKGMLLQHCHRQLYFAGLLEKSSANALLYGTPRAVLTSRAAQLLRGLGLFESLDEPSLQQLAAQLELLDLEAGEVLFAEHAADAALYVIATGILQLVRGVGSAAVDILGAIGAGDYIGEVGLFTGAPHAVTATALTYCHIFKLSRDAVAPLLAANADLAFAFDKSVRRGLKLLHRDVAVRASENVGTAGQLLTRIRAFFRPTKTGI